MICRLPPGREADLVSALGQNPALGIRIHSCYHIFGCDANILLQYAGDNPVAAMIGSEDGRWHAAVGLNSDLDELEVFFRSVSVSSLLTSPPLFHRLRDLGTHSTAPIMTCREASVPVDSSLTLCDSPSLEDVYRLLGEVTRWFEAESPWDIWYTHHSHMVRHQLGVFCGIHREGRLVSIGGIVGLGERYALLGSIATQRDWRGNGFASAIIRCLAHIAAEWGKIPCLFCAEDSLAGFYAKLGFQTAGRWHEIHCK